MDRVHVGALGGKQCAGPEEPGEAEDRVGRRAHGAAHRGEDLAADQVGRFGGDARAAERVELHQELPELGAGALHRQPHALPLLLGVGDCVAHFLEQRAPRGRHRVERAEGAAHGAVEPVKHAR